MEDPWNVVTRVSWRLAQPKPLLRTPAGVGTGVVWSILVLLFSIWSLLVPLKLDGLISLTWRQVWIPIFAICLVLYYVIWWLFPRYWISPPRLVLTAALFAVASVTSSNLLLVMQWDGFFDESIGLVMVPIWVFSCGLIATGWLYFFVYTIRRALNAMVFVVISCCFLIGLIFMAVKADTATQIPWIYIMTFLFWLPDLVILAAIGQSWRRAWAKAAKWPRAIQVRRPSAVVTWHLMMLVAWALVVIFEVALCLRADSLIEWSYLQVFLPLFLFDAYLILWTGIGLVTRAELERRTIVIATDNLISKRQHDLLINLNRKYDKLWSSRVEPSATLAHDLLMLLHDANRTLCGVPADPVLSSLQDPEYDVILHFADGPLYAHSSILECRKTHWDMFNSSLFTLDANGSSSSSTQTMQMWRCADESLSRSDFLNILKYLYTARRIEWKDAISFIVARKLDWDHKPEASLVGMFPTTDTSGSVFPRPDVMIRLRKHRFPAHRFVLMARSGFFSAMFRTGMKESRRDVIRLRDSDTSASLFQELIYSAYTDEIRVSDDMLVPFMYLAQEYQFSSVLEMASHRRLRPLVTINTAIEVASLAHHFLLPLLKVYCFCIVVIFLDTVRRLNRSHRHRSSNHVTAFDPIALLDPVADGQAENARPSNFIPNHNLSNRRDLIMQQEHFFREKFSHLSPREKALLKSMRSRLRHVDEDVSTVFNMALREFRMANDNSDVDSSSESTSETSRTELSRADSQAESQAESDGEENAV